jgi:hypothetical protein
VTSAAVDDRLPCGNKCHLSRAKGPGHSRSARYGLTASLGYFEGSPPGLWWSRST